MADFIDKLTQQNNEVNRVLRLLHDAVKYESDLELVATATLAYANAVSAENYERQLDAEQARREATKVFGTDGNAGVPNG